MAERQPRLTVLFDETCRFCTAVATWTVRASRGDVAARPIGSALGRSVLRDVDPARHYDSVHVVDGLGRRWSGAESLAPLFGALRGWRWAAWLADAFPGLAASGYAFVARHRATISRLTRTGRQRPLRRASRARAG